MIVPRKPSEQSESLIVKKARNPPLQSKSSSRKKRKLVQTEDRSSRASTSTDTSATEEPSNMEHDDINISVRVDGLQKSLQNLKEKEAATKEDLVKLVSQKKKLEGTISEYTLQIEGQHTLVEALNNQHSLLQQQLHETEAQLQKKKEEVDSISTMQSKASTYLEKLTSAESTAQNLQTELLTLQKKISIADSRITSLQTELSVSQNELTCKQTENAKLQQRYTEFQKDFEAYEKKNVILVNALKADNNKLDTDLNFWKNQSVQKHEYDVLQSKYEQAKKCQLKMMELFQTYIQQTVTEEGIEDIRSFVDKDIGVEVTWKLLFGRFNKWIQESVLLSRTEQPSSELKNQYNKLKDTHRDLLQKWKTEVDDVRRLGDELEMKNTQLQDNQDTIRRQKAQIIEYQKIVKQHPAMERQWAAKLQRPGARI